MAEITKLGRYQLRRVLGKGAMGVVYEGFDPSLNRLVAVKTILKSVVTDEESSVAYSARFAREAKAVARLSHPNIVQVYDFGEENEVAYLVMEFIQGRELRSFFEVREHFDAAEAVRIMGELLSALEFAHEAGVIHRDVKPANVMLDTQRHVKLADFGVARIQDGTDRSKGGTMVGTPAFMSPEQISGKKVDRRTDLFSAGIILYELLTGEQPFKGEGAWTVAKHIMQDEPPRPSTVAVTVSPAFDQIVNRALAKQPDQRFASAKEFSAALQGALVGGATQRGSDAEIEFWRSIQGSNDPAEFEVYLKEFPTGVYADLARIKIAKLPRFAPGAINGAAAPLPPSPMDATQAAELAAETARLEAELAQKEAEYKKREEEAAARQAAEAKARAEADAKREAEAKARAAIEEKARLEAIEKAKKEAQAELAKREAEYQKREADARAKAEAEAKARRELEEKAKKDAELRAKAEAEARARREAEDKARREAEAKARVEAEARAKKEAEERAKKDAEAARREAELKKKLAEAPKVKAPVVPVVISMIVTAAVATGIWSWYTASKNARVAELTAALEAEAKASEDLDQARRREEELLRVADLAKAAEEAARKSGDMAKLKEMQEATKKAETEAQKQNELVKQREAEAKKADEAARIAEAKKQLDLAKVAAEKAAQEKLAQEKIAQEQAAQKKAAADKAAAEQQSAEKPGTDWVATPTKLDGRWTGTAVVSQGSQCVNGAYVITIDKGTVRGEVGWRTRPFTATSAVTGYVVDDDMASIVLSTKVSQGRSSFFDVRLQSGRLVGRDHGVNCSYEISLSRG